MRFSYVTYAGNGSAVTFVVPFPYISRLHVTVLVNGASQVFTWDNATTVRLASAPANGASVRVVRTTPKDALLVDFQDASVLTESLLDLNAIQNLYIAQEAFDASADAVAFAQGLTVAVGNTPPPTVGDTGRVLRATGAGAVAWSDISVPLSAAPPANRTALGLGTSATLDATATGTALVTAASAAAARTAVGATTPGSSLITAADAAAVRAVAVSPPTPQTAAGVGQWVRLLPGVNNPAVLPAGGTWAWFIIHRDAGGLLQNFEAGVGAGGSTAAVAPLPAGSQWLGVAWRIA